MFSRKEISMIFLFLMLSFFNRGMGQDRGNPSQSYDFDVINLYSKVPGKSVTTVFVWIENSRLQFVKSDTNYVARYQLSVEVEGNNRSALLTQDTTVSVIEKQYTATIDPEITHIHAFPFFMSPDEYTFRVRFLDLNSTVSSIQEIRKNIFALDGERLELSDILILKTEKIDSLAGSDIVPPQQIPMADPLVIYAQIASPPFSSELHVECNMSNPHSDRFFTFSQSIKYKSGIMPVLLDLKKENMQMGECDLNLTVSLGKEIVETNKKITFVESKDYFTGLPVDDMIGPLEYVAGDEWNRIKNGTGNEKETLFETFWKKRDPTPDTEKNELYTEFYNRVQYADQNLGTAQQRGWKTDRGHVYILNGRPDDIERSTPNDYSNGLYEVWYYNLLKKKFVFLDEFGFGDYRLVSGSFL